MDDCKHSCDATDKYLGYKETRGEDDSKTRSCNKSKVDEECQGTLSNTWQVSFFLPVSLCYTASLEVGGIKNYQKGCSIR